jgi:hypothetical protein
MTPPGQQPRASRTHQPARTEPFLDRADIGLYREHRASERNHTALPQQPGQKTQREGRGLPRPEDRHGGGADQAGQRDSPIASASARSTAREHSCVVILEGGQQQSASLRLLIFMRAPRSTRLLGRPKGAGCGDRV